jgi:uncharacterized protein (DUF169 family)
MDLKQVNEILNNYIRPQTFPVALKLCRSQEDLPSKVRMPAKDMGHPITLCQAISLSRRYGWTMAVGKEDQCCAGGHIAMGFMSNPPKESLALFDPPKRHDAGQYSHLLSAPLDRANFEPDVICLYVNSAQAMRLAQAAGMGGGGVSAVATGFADCGDITARTVKTDICQFILPSGGDRVHGSTQDHEVIFTIPKSKIESMMKALEDTHKAGFRYPVLADVRHRPNLAPFLEIPPNAKN